VLKLKNMPSPGILIKIVSNARVYLYTPLDIWVFILFVNFKADVIFEIFY